MTYCFKRASSLLQLLLSCRSLHRTNAERIARGLPLKPPNSPGAPEAPSRAVIRVKNAQTGSILGHIFKNSFNKAQDRYQPSLYDALVVELAVDGVATSTSDVWVTTMNFDIGTSFSLLAFIHGCDNLNTDLGAGSFHYTCIGAPSNSVILVTLANSYT
ncbi:hypothetical protein Hypma_011843 [Hypsizygus marmoreus]|uniref:Uncharacterized protein n=1 Tax=Hypsizygus marmoreus TaxID=39966 RepID=A0A369JQQ7_HYPMA|nr:hypothetical protein Hypma_011843 [Hypsizygus marmoreus]